MESDQIRSDGGSTCHRGREKLCARELGRPAVGIEKGVIMEDRERLAIVLKHLLEHNEGHEEDYIRWIDLARNAGMNAIAALLEDANRHARQASEALKKAIDVIDK
jgi:hypothetical protein